ncbi:hypothetical protein [Roseomonas genomospecies 6]|uniref:Uncharacterized protein n=3 Tax=Alphaproteobacteria TaxID=28211 RepID=A0A9W7NII6_9PROT|nr:hypothetical protein [Roseomonas genomospecies 6]KAA0679568.1 hypothetical protein DS843_16670 [Roseomonas genomospecies 6]KAA0686208.1 hypothetical protein DS837_10960 [Azospirillum brasilense]
MFGAWLERRRYRTRVLNALMPMLDGLGLTSAKALLRHYPGIENAVLDHHGRGDDHRVAAMAIVGTVLTDQIERHYDADQRAAILAQLTDNATPKASKDRLAQAILSAEEVAHLWVENSGADRGLRDLMMSEIIGALQGYGAEERSRRRLHRALSAAVHATG